MKRLMFLMLSVLLLSNPCLATLIDMGNGDWGNSESGHIYLHDYGNGLIYDYDQDITWLQDANYAMTSGYDSDGRMTWTECMAWTEQFIYEGFDEWRLPTTEPPEYGYRNDSEMGHLFYQVLGLSSDQNYKANFGVPFTGPFIGIGALSYWSSTEHDADNAWRFDWGNGIQYYDSISSRRYAWAVYDGNIGVAPIPEPSTMLLFGSGLIGFMGFRRKFRK